MDWNVIAKISGVILTGCIAFGGVAFAYGALFTRVGMIGEEMRLLRDIVTNGISSKVTGIAERLLGMDRRVSALDDIPERMSTIEAVCQENNKGKRS